jgi:hypothetical protein
MSTHLYPPDVLSFNIEREDPANFRHRGLIIPPIVDVVQPIGRYYEVRAAIMEPVGNPLRSDVSQFGNAPCRCLVRPTSADPLDVLAGISVVSGIAFAQVRKRRARRRRRSSDLGLQCPSRPYLPVDLEL